MANPAREELEIRRAIAESIKNEDVKAELSARRRLRAFNDKGKPAHVKLFEAANDFSAEFLRATGGFATGALEGVGQAADITGEAALSLGSRVVGKGPRKIATDPNYFANRKQGPAQNFLGQPNQATQQFLGPQRDNAAGLAGAIAGGGATGGMARSLPAAGPKLLNALRTEAVPTLGAIGGGMGAQQVAPDSQAAELIGTLGGGMATALRPKNLGNIARRRIIGNKDAQALGRTMVANNAELGLPTTIAEASSRSNIQAAQSLLQRAPGNTAERTSKHLQERAKRALEDMTRTGNLDEASAGVIMREGMETTISEGVDRFSKAFKAYDKLIPDNTVVSMDNTVDALATVTRALRSARNDKEQAKLLKFVSTQVRDLLELLPADGDGTLSYGAMRLVRTRLGEWLRNKPVMLDMTKGEVNLLYGAISRDMHGAVRKIGGKKAAASFGELGSEYRNFAETTRELQGLLRKDGEKLFTSVFGSVSRSKPPSTEQALLVLDKLPTTHRDQVAGYFLNRMGTPLASRRGDVFGLESFLTRWNNALANNDPLRKAVFNSPGLRKHERGIQKLVDGLERTSETAQKIFNPSGSGSVGLAMASMWTGIGALVSGNPRLGATIAAPAFVINGANRLITYQKFVNWAVKATADRPAMFPSHVARLQATLGTDPEWHDEIEVFARDSLNYFANATAQQQAQQ